MSASAVAPPGWPRDLPGPATGEAFESRMVGWLLDRCPPEVRATAELRRQPAALALLAVAHTGAVVVGQRDAYRSARRELAAMLPAAALDAVLLDLEGVGHECVRTQREVGLVAEALAGRVWRAKL